MRELAPGVYAVVGDTGRGVEGGIAAGVVGGTGPVDNAQVFLEAQLDDPPSVLSPGPNRYPEVLRAAGISGRVVLEFVVDTSGHVDASSIKIVSTPYQGFNNAAREMVRATVFRQRLFRMLVDLPGRWTGEPAQWRLPPEQRDALRTLGYIN